MNFATLTRTPDFANADYLNELAEEWLNETFAPPARNAMADSQSISTAQTEAGEVEAIDLHRSQAARLFQDRDAEEVLTV